MALSAISRAGVQGKSLSKPPPLDEIIYGRDCNPEPLSLAGVDSNEQRQGELRDLALKLSRSVRPLFLMHYCNTAIAHRILGEKSIAATHVSKLQDGDQFEARQGWAMVQVAAELLVSQHPGDLVAQALEERIRYAKPPWDGPYWIHVACFSSEIGDEDLAWRFAKGGHPAGVRFNTAVLQNGFESAFKREAMQVRLEAVRYSGTEFIRVATTLMERALRRSHEWTQRLYAASHIAHLSAANRAFVSLQPELAMMSLTHKAAFYREEAEWRLVITSMPAKRIQINGPRLGQPAVPSALTLQWPTFENGPLFPATIHTF